MRAIDYYELERYCIDRGLSCVPVEVIKSMADVEAEPVRYGHWIKMKDDDPDDFRCSNCKAIAPIDEEAVLRTGKIHRFCSPRCMWCGAVMKGKEFEL